MSYIKYRDRCRQHNNGECGYNNQVREEVKKECHKPECEEIQTHVHEFAGSVMIAGRDPHNHRFAGVTSEEIPYDNTHVHAIFVNTDFYENHHHEIGIRTGTPIDVGNGKHVHLVQGETTTNFCHDHDFIFTTFIQDPIGEPEC